MAVKIRVGVNMAKKTLKFRKHPRQKRKLAKELIEVLLAERERYYLSGAPGPARDIVLNASGSGLTQAEAEKGR
jgi:hypothetical protein